jgi:hypothetical protein
MAPAMGGTGGTAPSGGATSGDGGAYGYDASDGAAGAAPCWGNSWDQAPSCAIIASCSPDDYTLDGECVQTGDCTFRFGPPGTFPGPLADVFVDCARVASDSWTLSDDQQTLSLTGSACEQARASGMPRIVVQLVLMCPI